MKATGFEQLEPLHEGGQAVVFRARRVSDGERVVLKMLRGPYPPPEARARFRREYELTKAVAGDGVIQVHSWAIENGIPLIVLEDFGADSLDHVYANERPSLQRAVELGLDILAGLVRVHDAGVLHLDMNPANVVVGGGVTKLIDFGLSSDLPRQNAELRASQVLNGTLRYIAPEQTGRTSRSIDHRSDFYGLGATLYWLTTGQPPFVSEDPLELVHAHIARVPAPASEVDGAIPAPLSAVIAKLLEKNAEDRYQSSFGIRRDLERCLDLIARNAEGKGEDAFEVGQDDRRARFQIPERLYGRQNELEQLDQALDRVRQGAQEVVFVHGRSGMGKTALVQELRGPALARGAAFVVGKFGQFKRDIPYASLIEALQNFVRHLLSGHHGDLESWRTRISKALAPNGALLVELIPKLALIIGEQPEAPVLPAVESEARLHRTFRCFLRVLATAEHPLVLFMDDLQWADLPSLSLLRVLATDPGGGHVLTIGAYRDNEVGGGHPLRAVIADLEAADVPILNLTVRPLAQAHVARMLADTMERPAAEVTELARHASHKTGGNPFFLHRFLQSLVAAEHIRFDGARGDWVWDVDAIAALSVTPNVVGFLTERLSTLPGPAQRQLEAGAVVGATFATSMLAAAQDLEAEAVLAGLREPLREGLVEELEAQREASDDSMDRVFRFAHDRIQQAAYERTTDEHRRVLHHRVGRRTFDDAGGDPEALGDALFAVVNHLDAGLPPDASDDDRLALAQLNLLAGRRALQTSAYAPAGRYLEFGRELLGAPAWESAPDLMRALTQAAATAAYLLPDFEAADRLVDEALEHARSPIEKAEALVVRIDSNSAQNLNLAAISVGLEALALLGVSIDEDPTVETIGARLGATFAGLDGVDLPGLADRTPPDDPAIRLAMRLVCTLAPPAYYVKQTMLPLLGAELVDMSVRHGPTPESSYGFALLGLVLCDAGQIDEGYGFGQLAIQLAGRFDDKRLRVRSGHVANGFTRPWKEPAGALLTDYARLFDAAMDIGDFEYAGYIGMLHSILSVYLAPDLVGTIRSARHWGDAMREMQQDQSLFIHGAVSQAAQNLLEPAEDPAALDGEFYNGSTMIPFLEERGDPGTLLALASMQASLTAYYGDWARCREFVAQQRAQAAGGAGIIHKVYVEQWDALSTLIVAIRQPESGKAAAALAAVQEPLAKLSAWAGFNDALNGHRPALVRAVMAWLQGDMLGALAGFERVATMARERQLPMDEGLAHRLAGEMCLEAGLTTAARAHLVEACYSWDRWGATALREDLQRRYPTQLGDLGTSAIGGAGTSTITTARSTMSADIDAIALVRASQAIAGEIDLVQVIRSVVGIAMEVSGADHSVLVSQVDGVLVVSAVGQSGGIVVPEEPGALHTNQVGAAGIIRYVARTQEEVVLDDATRSDLFASDSYVVAQEVRSVLCLPIEQHNKLLGVLYLEHRTSHGVFTQQRVALLKVLMGQAVISLTNATLVDTLEESVRERTEQLAIATEQAVAASEHKSVFLRSMGHELRTPLNAILGYSALLKSASNLTDKQRAAMGVVEKSGRHLLSLINDVLDMSRIEAGRLELTEEPMKLAGLARDVVDFCRPDAKQKGVGLTVHADAALPAWVLGDARRLRQVLLNLVGNAVKFTTSGQVTVRTRRLADHGIRVEVQDTGPGVEAHRLEAIFEPFVQSGDATQRAKGTGLGLAISRQLARRMGGDLWAESTLGEGSTFILEVSLEACEAPAAEPSAAPVAETLEPEAEPAQTQDLVWPARVRLEALIRLVEEGALSDVAREASLWASADDTLRPFAEQVAAFAAEFDDEGIERFLAAGLDERA